MLICIKCSRKVGSLIEAQAEEGQCEGGCNFFEAVAWSDDVKLTEKPKPEQQELFKEEKQEMAKDVCVKCGGSMENPILEYKERCYNSTYNSATNSCNWNKPGGVEEHLHVKCPHCGVLATAVACSDFDTHAKAGWSTGVGAVPRLGATPSQAAAAYSATATGTAAAPTRTTQSNVTTFVPKGKTTGPAAATTRAVRPAHCQSCPVEADKA